MDRKLVNSQLTNFTTYMMYLNQLESIAQNVFIFENVPNSLNTRYINNTLLVGGKIAFFKDEYLGILALPFEDKYIKRDIYDEPIEILVRSKTNNYKRILHKNEFVIMYDNNIRLPILPDLFQYAERLALCMRTCDINIVQQKTPRFWKTKNENLKTLKDLLNNVDTFEDTIITYKDLDLDDTTLTLEPSPYVADKIDMHYEKIWNEFLRFVGVTNLSYTKKERNISDEINAMQGGTIASRINRFEPRKTAVEKINEKFGTEISVKYYDGLPDTNKKEDDIDDFSLDTNISDFGQDNI